MVLSGHGQHEHHTSLHLPSQRFAYDLVMRYQLADFAVNSKNFMDKSRGTETWIAECKRLFERCVAGANKGRKAEVQEFFEILFDLLRHIDEGNPDVVFFADEGGSWQVGVRWENVLPTYFACLSAIAEPGEYAQKVTAVLDDFVHYDRDKYLRKERGAGTAAQRKLLG